MKILKLIPALFCALLFTVTGNASLSLSAVAVTPGRDSLSKPLVTSTEKLKVEEMKLFAKMSMADYEKLRGKKLNTFERLSFKLTQHRVNKMLKHYSNGDSPTTLEKISWLLKGILLGPVALLIGYIFLKDEERELIKWIWFGFIGWSIILAIILFA